MEKWPRQAGHLHCVAPILSREDLDGFVDFQSKSTVVRFNLVPQINGRAYHRFREPEKSIKIPWFQARSCYFPTERIPWYAKAVSAIQGTCIFGVRRNTFLKTKSRSNHCWPNFGYSDTNLWLPRDWRVPCFYSKPSYKNMRPFSPRCLHISRKLSRKFWWTIFLAGGFIFFYFHPYLGKWSNLTNIFQMGWNHQQVFFTKNPRF